MDNQNKNQKEFIKQFQSVSLFYAFKTIFEKNEIFREQLFHEFIKTEIKPNLGLYIAQYLTDEEIYADWAVNHSYSVAMDKRLHEIRMEFDEKYKTIDQLFHTHEIKATKIVQTLRKIEEELRLLHGQASKNSDRATRDNWAEIFAENIHRLLTSLGNKPLATEVYEAILTANADEQVGANAFSGPGHDESYKFLIGRFNHYFHKYDPASSTALTNDKQPKNDNQQIEGKVYKACKYQNFLDEVNSIEASLGSMGKKINPTFYASMATLWGELSNEKIEKVRDIFRKEVRNQLDSASEFSYFLVNEYQAAVKMQPDRQRELLIEHRNKWVDLLTEKYSPIKRWYIEFDNEADKTVERIKQIESGVFLFCYENNRSFMVGRTLLLNLYTYRLTIDRLNKLLQNLQTGDELSSHSQKPQENLIYESFEDLFINPADVEPCVNALRRYRPEKPILGEGKNWTGSRKDKGLLVGWIERMEMMKTQKIHKITNRKRLVILLNEHFENLDMGKDASVFAKVVEADVKFAFAALIPE